MGTVNDGHRTRKLNRIDDWCMKLTVQPNKALHPYVAFHWKVTIGKVHPLQYKCIHFNIGKRPKWHMSWKTFCFKKKRKSKSSSCQRIIWSTQTKTMLMLLLDQPRTVLKQRSTKQKFDSYLAFHWKVTIRKLFNINTNAFTLKIMENVPFFFRKWR